MDSLIGQSVYPRLNSLQDRDPAFDSSFERFLEKQSVDPIEKAVNHAYLEMIRKINRDTLKL